MMNSLTTDLRHAVRLLRRSPGWSAIAIVSLALGIGGNAVVFSLVDAVLLKPFPYRDANRIVLLWGSKSEDTTRGISGADLNDWREQSRAFESLDAFLGNLAFSLGADESDRVKAACIGHRVLPMLGVQPSAGRNFTEADAQYGAAPVVLISDGIWRSRFGGSPSAVGAAIRLDDRPYEIVGVMPWAPRPLEIDNRIPADLTVGVWAVGPEYFAAAGIPLREGREFTAMDDGSAPKRVIVSEALARRAWPNAPPIGKSLKILEMKTIDGRLPPGAWQRLQQLYRASRGWPGDPTLYDPLGGGMWEVIGVAANVRMFGLNLEPNPALYVDPRQLPPGRAWSGTSSLKVLLRTSRPASEVIELAKTHILAANRDVTFAEIVPMAELVAQSIGGRGSNKLLLIVATVFGTLALMFATIGIYGVVAQNVNQRLREIGIRVALGADRRHVLRVVLGYAGRLLVTGLALGLTVAWAATRGMTSLLFATAPTDPGAYAAAVTLLVVAALLACALPLRRALRLDPVVLFKA